LALILCFLLDPEDSSQPVLHLPRRWV